MQYFTNLSRREFIWGMSCACGTTLILPSCAEVAISDRKQIKIFSDDYLHSKAFPAYENFKSQAKLITDTSESQKIIDNINDSRVEDKAELIQVIKTNSEKGCWDAND